jgi:hypothetical protein
MSFLLSLVTIFLYWNQFITFKCDGFTICNRNILTTVNAISNLTSKQGWVMFQNTFKPYTYTFTIICPNQNFFFNFLILKQLCDIQYWTN